MDPLSALASIVGLLAVSAKVTKALSGAYSGLKDAPKSINSVIIEVQGFHNMLSSLHRYVQNNLLVSSHRAALIDIDQLIVSLTESVLMFSELDEITTSLTRTGSPDLQSSIKALWKEDEITKLMQRLQQHKASLSLLLNIIQCESDIEAAQAQVELRSLVEQVLLANRGLMERMKQLEDSYTALSTSVGPSRDNYRSRGGDASTISTVRDSPGSLEDLSRCLTRFAFQDDLESSWVYRRVDVGNDCDHSFHTSVLRSDAWSIFSGLSLAEISKLSVIALPLFRSDLTNAPEYTFGLYGANGNQQEYAHLVSGSPSASDVTGNPIKSSTLLPQRSKSSIAKAPEGRLVKKNPVTVGTGVDIFATRARTQTSHTMPPLESKRKPEIDRYWTRIYSPRPLTDQGVRERLRDVHSLVLVSEESDPSTRRRLLSSARFAPPPSPNLGYVSESLLSLPGSTAAKSIRSSISDKATSFRSLNKLGSMCRLGTRETSSPRPTIYYLSAPEEVQYLDTLRR